MHPSAELRAATPAIARRTLLMLGISGIAGLSVDRASAGSDAPDGRDDHGDQRTDCSRVFFPLDGATGGDAAASAAWLAQARRAADAGDASLAFRSLMRAHHADPSDGLVRRMLNLPTGEAATIAVGPGRSAPPVLRWRAGSYLQAQTPHFTVLSAADAARTRQVAAELERFYWIWAQTFFPVWDARSDVPGALQGGRVIASGARRLRVVLFADRDSYIAALRPHVPGVEQSTGFYSDPQRATFLVDGTSADDLATRHHELTHQLLREATGSQWRGRGVPGEATDFWLIEGVASYMESVRVAETYGWVGGWESPRLQFARYRWLVGGDRLRLAEIAGQGRRQVQQRDDLPRWYSYAAAYAHLLMDGGPAAQQAALLGRLQQLYAVAAHPGERRAAPASIDVSAAGAAMNDYLHLDDASLQPPDAAIPITAICLGRTAVTAAGLAGIPPQTQLNWLDLSHMAIDSAAVVRLVAGAAQLQQLNLEATGVDDGLAAVLQSAGQLRELDLSFTRVTDACLDRVAALATLETLWLTGTAISDATVHRLIDSFPALQSVDLQRTAVTAAGVARLKQARPRLQVDPLTLVDAGQPPSGDPLR